MLKSTLKLHYLAHTHTHTHTNTHPHTHTHTHTHTPVCMSVSSHGPQTRLSSQICDIEILRVWQLLETHGQYAVRNIKPYRNDGLPKLSHFVWDTRYNITKTNNNQPCSAILGGGFLTGSSKVPSLLLRSLNLCMVLVLPVLMVRISPLRLHEPFASPSLHLTLCSWVNSILACTFCPSWYQSHVVPATAIMNLCIIFRICYRKGCAIRKSKNSPTHPYLLWDRPICTDFWRIFLKISHGFWHFFMIIEESNEICDDSWPFCNNFS